jgi:Uma2 family endonuclease
MATDLATRPMTTDEFLELADEEGVTRELIDGVLVEREMTTRNAKHSTATTRISKFLDNWLDEQTEIVGVVGSGEVRCRLATNPDLIVGVDVVYYEGEEYARQAEEDSFFDGPPVVAVEVLSPSDKHEEIVEKIRRYLSAGVKQVWIADPDLRNVTVHRSTEAAALFNAADELAGDPELPGFRVRVETLFSSGRR